jgi:hypothetical protein
LNIQSNNHEYFLDENQTPLLPSTLEDEQGSPIVFSSQKTIMDYVSLEGIENRTGVGKENLYGFTLKEVMDNALDSHETQSSKDQPKDAEVRVTITKEGTALSIIVRNSNDYGNAPFSKEKLESILNSNTFYSSKRNQYKISRGVLDR